jgi:hypothetical protein
VGHQVPKGTKAVLLFKAPREEPKGVAGVAIEKASVVVGDRSQFARGDEVAGVLNDRRPAVVVAGKTHHPRPLHRIGSGDRLLGKASHRLFTRDVLARRRCRVHEFQVHTVGRGDIHHIYIGVVDHLAPVGDVLPEAEPFLRGFCPLLIGVGAHHQDRIDPLFDKPVGYHPVRPGVDVSHPPHSDNPDSNRFSGHIDLLHVGLFQPRCVR